MSLNWEKANRKTKKPSSELTEKELKNKYAKWSKPKRKIEYEVLWCHCKNCNIKIHSKYKLCYNCWKKTLVPEVDREGISG